MQGDDKGKEKKDTKQRYLSPSFRKGQVKEEKDEKGDQDFKINLMIAEDDDESLSPPPKEKKRTKRMSVQGETMPSKVKMNENANLSPLKPEDTVPKEFATNALPNGHVKKIASLSQAGKGEDGFTKVNQDNFLIIQNEYNLNDFKIFAVMDGHGINGHLVSKYVVKYFTAYLKKNKKMNCLKSEDEVYQRIKKHNSDIIERAFRHAERDLGKSDIDANFSGTTCVMVFQIGDRLFCANVGDSRAILVKKGGEIFPLSIDQKPNDPSERKRIESNGGEVSQYEEDGEASGPFRVWKKGEMYPGIAMSRSIGDLIASTLGVVPEPEFRETKIDENAQFIILASDGVWEFLKNEDVANLVMPFYLKNDPDGACHCLIKESTKWWNKEDIVVDDITAIAVFF